MRKILVAILLCMATTQVVADIGIQYATEGGGGGIFKAPQYKAYGLNILNKLIENKIKKVQDLPIHELLTSFVSAPVYFSTERPKFNGEEYDAVYIQSQNRITVWENWEGSKSNEKAVNVIHEAIRYYNANNGRKRDFNDDGYGYSLSIVQTYNSLREKNISQGINLPTVPLNFETVMVQIPRYNSFDAAATACKAYAKEILEQYKQVICEPIFKTKHRQVIWSYTEYVDVYHGLARSRERHSSSSSSSHKNSGSWFFAGRLLSLFVSPFTAEGTNFAGVDSGSYNDRSKYKDKESYEKYTETPIITKEPRVLEFTEEVQEITYGFRIIAANEKIVNQEADRVLFDGKSQLLEFSTAAASLQHCSDFAMQLTVRADFIAVCENYQTETGTFSYKVIGKEKYK